MVASVTIATVIGIPAAWAQTTLRESSRPARYLSEVLVAILGVSVLIPLVLHAAAWEATAGKFGFTMLTQTGSPVLSGDRYGMFSGMVATSWIHGIHGAALVALATSLGVARCPASVIDQARLDLGPIARWWRIRLPVASPWWIAAMMGTAGLAATEMTVADLYGYRTIADQFYLSYAITPTLSAVAGTCIVPLLIAGVAMTYLAVSRHRPIYANHQYADPHRRGGNHRRLSIRERYRTRYFRGAKGDFQTLSEPISGPVLGLAVIIIFTVIALIAGVPIVGLVNKLGQVVTYGGTELGGANSGETELSLSWSWSMAIERFAQTPRLFASEYRWTAIISVVTTLAAVTIAWPLVSLGRRQRRYQITLDLVSVALVCIPGPIVGLAVVSIFQSQFPGARFLYQQTIVPTVISLLFRAGPVAYWIIRSGYRSIESSTWDMAQLESGPLRQFWEIERPLVWHSVTLALLVSTVVASGDLPAMLPVLPAGVTTVPVRLFGLLHSGARYQEAALAMGYIGSLSILSLLAFRRNVT